MARPHALSNTSSAAALRLTPPKSACYCLPSLVQTGVSGDSADGGGSRANYPTFYAVLYDPTALPGARYTTLARSQIARLYHSTTALTVEVRCCQQQREA